MDLSYRVNRPEIKVEVRPEDYIMMGASGIKKREVLQKDSRWRSFIPTYELQRNVKGDVFGCVSFAHNNANEFIHKRKYGSEININDRVLVVGSGTTPSVGNSPVTVADWERKNGMVIGEEKWPYTAEMTVDEYYNGGVVPNDLLIEAKENLDVYGTGYEWCDNWIKMGRVSTSPENIIIGLQFSPIVCSVDGMYQFDSNGHIKWTGGRYTHEVVVFDYEDDNFWVFDSEMMSIIKFRRDYPFGWPMVKYFQKKTNIETAPYLLRGKSLYALGKGGKLKGKYVPIIDGDDYKFWMGNDYPKHPDVKEVTELPTNIADDVVYSIVDKEAFFKYEDKLKV